MNNNLVVRVFNVEVGDCIYVRVPNGDEFFHILIDCGTRGSRDLLESAMSQVKEWLPSASGRRAGCSSGEKWLDLLVVTHPDSDHTNGFEKTAHLDVFQGIRIGQMWLNPLLDDRHPQATRAHALMELVDSEAGHLYERHHNGLLALDGPALDLVQSRMQLKEGALKALKKNLDPDCPRYYMCRDFAPLSKTRGFKFEQGATCFCGFRDESTKLRILAPEWDIDEQYLGEAGSEHPDYRSVLSQGALPAAVPAKAKKQSDAMPRNIGVADFWQLRNGMQYSALGFLATEDFLQNNTSLVLLLEWQGHRLLFPGDAECLDRHSSWQVMLKHAKPWLDKPLDYLKVGHHGSINATPVPLLDALLDKAQSHVVVSTRAGVLKAKNNPVPNPSIMQELGKRAINAKKYGESYKEPERTDRENKPYIETLISPRS